MKKKRQRKKRKEKDKIKIMRLEEMTRRPRLVEMRKIQKEKGDREEAGEKRKGNTC